MVESNALPTLATAALPDDAGCDVAVKGGYVEVPSLFKIGGAFWGVGGGAAAESGM